MRLLTRNTDYAVRALCFMARHRSNMVSATALVKELKIPRPFLRKILQILNKKRFLKSYKGQAGGFMLALAPDRIYLIDLMQIFQGPLKLNECLFKREICPERSLCALKQKIDALERYVLSQLEKITIESLL